MWLSGALWQTQHFSGSEVQHSETLCGWWWGAGRRWLQCMSCRGKPHLQQTHSSWTAPHDKIHPRIIKRDGVQSRTWGGVLTNLFHITGAHLTEHIFLLPGIEILCPGLQNVWETDGEISQSYDGICSDHRKSGALEHREHETDVFLTRRWADRKEARNYNFKIKSGVLVL